MSTTSKDLLQRIDEMQDQIASLRPLTAEQSQQLRDYYRIGLTYSSNALEGNSLTETETKVVLEDGITVAGKPMKDHLEAIGHSDATKHLFEASKSPDITIETILTLHQLLYGQINADKAGIYRDVAVVVTGSRYNFPKPEDVPGLMDKLIESVAEWSASMHPVIVAANIHRELVRIHPFVDGNGRAARLLMNLALLQAGFLVTIIPPVRRADYIDALEHSHMTRDSNSFDILICEMVIESQKDYLRLFSNE